MAIKIYHCKGARSLRPVWTAEEMELDYELETLPFPPRVLQKDYLSINPLGTVPCMTDGDTWMSESAGISHYFVEKYGPTPLRVDPTDPEYGSFLNWTYFSDATLTFPQTLFLRYTRLEPEQRRVPQVAEDYRRWFLGRLRLVEQATADREFLVCGRFTIADICVGYGLKLAMSLGIDDFKENTRRYWDRLQEIPSYQRVADL
ncbi:MAG: glutathione S-transferase family protein [Acidobacteriota bacterium]|nr:glutathione S-transferase family protein [Acidobacteriota bacterium]